MLGKWLDYLVAPINKQPLMLDVNISHGENVIAGELLCEEGGYKYPIVNGIPRFVSKELYDETQPIDTDVTQTGRSFGNKWRQKASRALGQTDAEIKALEEQFLAMLGITNRNALNDLFKNGMNCLNAGCGVAWSEYLFNVNRDVNRFAVDLSLSVEVAYKKTKTMDNIFVAQADLFKLPFRYNFFDIIFSDGVLHHTGNAKRGFEILCNHLKPGGLIGIYIYCVKPFLRELADKEIRKITTEMSFVECAKFSEQIAKLGESLQIFKDQLIIEDDIPLLGIKKGTYNLQKFIYDHFLKCYYNEDMGYDLSALVNVDWYHPKYASHHTREEVASWFEDNGIVDVQFIQPKGWQYSGYFVSGRKAKK